MLPMHWKTSTFRRFAGSSRTRSHRLVANLYHHIRQLLGSTPLARLASPRRALLLLTAILIVYSIRTWIVHRQSPQDALYTALKQVEHDTHTVDDGADNAAYCPRAGESRPLAYWADTDIRMERVYDAVPQIGVNLSSAGHPNGYAYGLEVEYDRRRVLEEEPTLEVILMPHSHVDPGWLATFQGYYPVVSQILSGSHSYLTKHPNVSFEWAELCYLEWWWRNHGVEEREAFTRVVENGQLEILTGGWVMADEANTHYYALIMQLLEGHEWLRNHMPNVTPVSHWTIDSFGLSPTLPYLLQEANIKQGVVLKIHYAAKAYLAARRQLEFRWRQSWAGSSDATDFLTHMPMAGFHVSESCGPEGVICCQFDFTVAGKDCLGGRKAVVVAINDDNLVERADMLADQFRKKAQLYNGENVIFVMWGEDQRYAGENDWRIQHGSLQRLFDHINSHPQDYNIHVRFGTVKQYFDLLHERRETRAEVEGDGGGSGGRHFPTLSGDFYPHANEKDVYWTGYYTTRPFNKQLDRVLQHYVRAADILFTAALNMRGQQQSPQEGEGGKRKGRVKDELAAIYPPLVEVRRALGLFQHHDAITGTCKSFVVKDFAERLLKALNMCLSIIASVTTTIYANTSGEQLGLETARNEQPSSYRVDQEFPDMTPPKQSIIPPPSELVLFNPLGQARREVVCVLIPPSIAAAAEGKNTQKVVRVYEYGSTTEDGRRKRGSAAGRKSTPHQQIEPVIEVLDGKLTLATDKQKLCFQAELPALGLRRYYLDHAEGDDGENTHRKADVKLFLKGEIDAGNTAATSTQFTIERLEKRSSAENAQSSTPIVVENDHVSIGIDPRTGLLRQFALKKSKRGADQEGKNSSGQVPVELSFVKYGEHERPHGYPIHYLFIPDGPAEPLPGMSSNTFMLIDGPVRKSIVVKLAEPVNLVHTVELSAHSDALSIRNLIELTHEDDVELAMRVKTKTEIGEFYTELNAYQFTRRRRNNIDKLALPAQFFPMPGAVLLQGGEHRLTLLGNQALGTTSLEPGSFDVLLDRRLNDVKDFHEGVKENWPTESRFRLLLEEFHASEEGDPRRSGDANIAYHSVAAFHNSLELHYPIITMWNAPSSSSSTGSQRSVNLVTLLGKAPLPCDVHLVALRTLSQATEYNPTGGDTEFSKLTTLPKPAAALILHRAGVECSIAGVFQRCAVAAGGRPEPTLKPGVMTMKSLFGVGKTKNTTVMMPVPNRVAEASLTLLSVAGGNVDELSLAPMEIKSWLLEF